MIKQNFEKVFDKDTPLAENVRILFHEQCITVVLMATTLTMTILTTVLTIAIAIRPLSNAASESCTERSFS